MNYRDFRRRIWILRVAGACLALAGLVLTFVSLLKLLYYGMPAQGGELANALNTSIQRFVYVVYSELNLVSAVWSYAPTPTTSKIVSAPNGAFVLVYMLFFAGVATIRYAGSLADRLKRTMNVIDDEKLRQSYRESRVGGDETAVDKAQRLELHLAPPQDSLLKNIHALYVAPIIVLILGSIILSALDVM